MVVSLKVRWEGFTLKVLEVEGLQKEIQDMLGDMEEKQREIEAIQRAVRRFYSLDDGFKGKAGKAIRHFYKDMHEPFLIFLHQSFTDLSFALQDVSKRITSFEPAPGGYVSQRFLEREVTEGFERVGREAVNLTNDAQAILDQVRDLVSIRSLDGSEVMDSVNDGKHKADGIIEGLFELDRFGVSRLEDTRSDLRQMKAYLSEMTSSFSSAGSIKNYSPELTQGMSAYEGIRESVPLKTNKLDETSLMSEIEKAKQLDVIHLSEEGKNILSQAFSDLESGQLSQQEYLQIRKGIKAFDQAIQDGKSIEPSTALVDYTDKIEQNKERTKDLADYAIPVYNYSRRSHSLYKAFNLTRKGFRIEPYETKSGIEKFRVHHPEAGGIRKPKNNRKTKLYDRTYIDRKEVKTKISSRVKPITGAVNSLKSRAGWVGVALNTGLTVKQNIQEGESTGKIVKDAGIDVGVGAVSLAVAGAATAIAVGSFGVPIIAGAAIGIAASTFVAWGVEKAITGAPKAFKAVAGWFK